MRNSMRGVIGKFASGRSARRLAHSVVGIGVVAVLAYAILYGNLFGVAGAAAPPPTQPILVIQDPTSSNTYQYFVPEVLHAEGIQEFQVANLGDLSSTYLANFDVVILPSVALSSSQASMLAGYVTGGGYLIGLRPGLQLASTFGVAPVGTTMSEGWLKIDTTQPGGAGLEQQTMKFHGSADLYTPGTATVLATLYKDSATATIYPAVALNQSGSGHTVLFTYDLALSLVQTRQGNPQWAGYPNNHDGFVVMRPSQMFLDTTSGISWNSIGDGTLTSNRNDVPQADEQMRLFGNLLVWGNASKRPLPRLWYLPNQKNAMLLFTGDQHGNGDTVNASSEVSTVQSFGGSMDVYLWYPYGTIDATTVNNWVAAGHGVGVHFDDTAEMDSTAIPGSHVTFAGMSSVVASSLASFPGTFPNAPSPVTTRNHHLLWASTDTQGNPDQTAQARIFQASGIRLDVTYSSFPNTYGYMTGSGLPMQFLDPRTGALIPVYEQATQYEDDIQLSSNSYSLAWDLPTAQSHYQKSLLDSLTKYNTAVTMLFHPDQWSFYQPEAQGVLQYAQSQNIPIWGPQKWLNFWQGRAAATISNVAFNGSTLSFNVGNAVSGLTLLLPNGSGANAVSAIQMDGTQQNFKITTLQGVDYANFVLTAGNHTVSVTYSPVWSISGLLTPTEAVSATTLTITGGPQSISLKTIPAADGTYQFGRLLNGIYTITPSSDPYTYQPSSLTVTVAGANVTNENFTASVIPVTQTLFTTQTPVFQTLNDGVNYELGLRFRSDVIGDITAIRYWKAAGDNGTHVGRLWSAGGGLLASVTFTNETASGWQQQTLPTPIRIAANTEYVATVNTANNLYADTDRGLAQQVVNLRLSSIVGGNGVYGSPGQFPTNSYINSNYFRDVVFTTNRTYVISGNISPSSLASGANVALSGFSSASTTADSSGNYSFGGLANGTYTVTPSKAGYVFTPASQTVPINNGDATTVNFTVAPKTYNLFGSISPSASGSGATVSLTGSVSATVLADSSGNFTFTGLPNGTYGLEASKTGFTFSPVSQTATVNGGDVTGVTFTASATSGGTYAISGNISGTASVSSTNLTLSGAASGTTTVNSSGNYSFVGLANGTYTITPQQQGVAYSPTSQSVTVQGANISGVNFTASQATLIESLFTTQTPTQTNLTDGTNVNYELGTKFTAAVPGQIVAIRFWKASSESGTHVGHLWSASGQLLASVTFTNETASGWQQQYLATPLQISRNTVYVVSVNTGGTFYVETPSGLAQQVTNLDLSSVVGSNGVYGSPGVFPTQTFSSSNYFRDVAFANTTAPLPTSFSISGTISPSANGSGATITLTGPTNTITTSDSAGNFSFTNLPNGTYTLAPTKGGFIFSPSNQSVSINQANVTGVSFTANSLQGSNPIVIENSFTGTSSWQLVNPAFLHEIEGYAGATSVNKSQSITFFVNSNGAQFTLNVFRLGWYQSLGGRLMVAAGTLPGQSQSSCPQDLNTGMTACSWNPSYTLTTGSNWTTGLYMAKVTRTDTGKDNYIAFVVRDDASTADILLQSSFNTMEAYNNWGGKSLYYFQSSGPNPTQSVSAAAVKVSFDRPFNTFNPANSADSSEFPLRWDYLMIRFLEQEGFNVAYSTDPDTHVNGAALLQHRIFMTDGHSEYWTSQMRNNVEAARNNGINLSFFSANTSYWQVRYEPNAAGVPNRVMVGYKESAPSFDPNVNDPSLSTTRFRDSFINRPENQLLGVMYGSFTSDPSGYPLVVTNPQHPFYRNTGVANQTSIFGIVGNEWDNTVGADASNIPTNIQGLTILSNSPTTLTSYSNSVVYQAPSGALVFAAGTIQWAWGLDNFNTPVNAEDPRIRQMTANILMDMGDTPQTPTSEIVVSSSYSISGTISPAVAGVQVRLSGAAAAAVTTNSSGNYVFKVLTNGTYSVQPSLTGYSFTPASGSVTINGASVTGVNFTAVNQVFTVSGTVSPSSGGSGTTLTLGGAGTATVTADASGNYSFSSTANGTFTVTPSKTGYTYNPTSQSVTVNGANVTGINFTANVVGQGSFVISGTISPASTASGSTVTLSGTISATATADATGNYSFSNVPNGTYTVTPSKTGNTFTPSQQNVTIAGANVSGINFTVATQSPPQTLLTTQTPAATGLNDGVGYELGMRFFSNVTGQITAIRFWKSSGETGTHVGHIWSATGQLLATVTFTNETASGWQQQNLASPLSISANTEYLVSVNTGSNNLYVVTNTGFATQINNGNLFSIVGGNGRYGPPGQYPTNTYQSSNYFRDIVFVH